MLTLCRYKTIHIKYEWNILKIIVHWSFKIFFIKSPPCFLWRKNFDFHSFLLYSNMYSQLFVSIILTRIHLNFLNILVIFYLIISTVNLINLNLSKPIHYIEQSVDFYFILRAKYYYLIYQKINYIVIRFLNMNQYYPFNS